MAKPRESRRDEFYKSRIRELEKEVRSLTKHLKDLEKAKHIYEDVIIGEIEPEELAEKNNKVLHCTSCGKGTITTIELLDKVYGTCSVCGPTGRIK